MLQLRNFIDNYIFSFMGYLLIFWISSWILMLIFGRPLIEWLRHRKGMKWAPREDTPDSHAQKAGTPSMGGIGIIGAAALGYFSFSLFTLGIVGLTNPGVGIGMYIREFPPYLIFPILVGSHALLGYIDDHSKATNRGGLSSKTKLFGQILLAVLFLLAIHWVQEGTLMGLGRFESTIFDSWLLVLGALLVIIGTSNAVNLTDGIDGLAAGLCVQVGAIFALLSFETSMGVFDFLSVGTIHFWMCLGGACLGFLAFNKYPAKVFMGDTGSLALGAALGAGAILTRTVWLLPFIGFIFFVEMFSVIFQVIHFKYTKKKFGEGRRIFRRAPLHHHFELGGWSEWRVVGTFWMVNLATSILGLALWKMGILPRFP